MKRYSWQPETKNIPTNSGVYRFISSDQDGEFVLYVGKAKNLRNRLANYFQDPNLLQARTASMLSQVNKVSWTIVNSEVEALQLEHSLIQEFKPKYNIRFRDDKSYPYICVTTRDPVPRIFSTRKKGIPGARYFGPYPNSNDVRTSIELLTKIFPVRSCAPVVFKNHQRSNRACLLGHIGRCSAPCLSESDPKVHASNVQSLLGFLNGGDREVIKLLNEEMSRASLEERFEDAAKLRDQLSAIESILAKSSVTLERDLIADFIGIAYTELDSVISLIQVRNGRVVGEEKFSVDLYAEAELYDVLAGFLFHHYVDKEIDIPKEIYVSGVDFHLEDIQVALSSMLNKKIHVSKPLRGEKLGISLLALKNAESELQSQRQSILSDLNSRSKALKDLAINLKLDVPPFRIECVDVSHLQGSSRVAAVVVFEDGMPNRNEYRSYVLRNPGDDLAGIREVISRRVKFYKERKNRYPIGLLVIDGGPWQALAASQILKEHDLDIPTVGLAKRLEEIWWPGGKTPLMLPRDSSALYLLQQLRDETHRRAISHHRKRRSRQAVASLLDEIEGIGPEKRKLLLRHFGGSHGLKAASLEDLAAVKGIGMKIAKDIYAELHNASNDLKESAGEGK